MQNVYVSFCTAQTGLNPTENSLLAFGAQAFLGDGTVLGDLEVCALDHPHRPPDAAYLREHWQHLPDQWQHVHQHGMSLARTTQYISNWLRDTVGPRPIQWLSTPTDNGFFKSNYMERMHGDIFPINYEFIDITTFLHTYCWSQGIENGEQFAHSIVGASHHTPFADAVRQAKLFLHITGLWQNRSH